MKATCLALALALSLGAAVPPARGADEAGKKKEELSRIKREMQQKKQALKRADRQERSVLADIEKLDKAVQAGDAELAVQQQRLREAEAALRGVERNASEVQRSLDLLQRTYRQRVRALYKMGRLGYAATVFSSEDLNSALKRVKYLAEIAEQDREVMKEYGAALDRLAREQTDIARRKEELARRRQIVAAKKAELESKRGQKATLLAGVRQQKGLYEQTLKELEESSASLWAMIKKEEQEKKAAQARKAAEKPAARKTPQQSAGETPLAVAPGARGRLPWPINGHVVTPFGMQRHPQFGTLVFRRGIEIEAREGEGVRAVNDGQVVYADWYKGYGKLMILEHGSGVYTLYGHLARIDVNKGDAVKQGQVVGLAGDTGSQRGTRLYFEIRSNGEAQDPLAWLAKR